MSDPCIKFLLVWGCWQVERQPAGLLTVYDGMPRVQLRKTTPDDNTEIWQNLRKVVGQESAESPDEAHSLGSPTVKPVEAMHSVFRL